MGTCTLTSRSPVQLQLAPCLCSSVSIEIKANKKKKIPHLRYVVFEFNCQIKKVDWNELPKRHKQELSDLMLLRHALSGSLHHLYKRCYEVTTLIKRKHSLLVWKNSKTAVSCVLCCKLPLIIKGFFGKRNERCCHFSCRDTFADRRSFQTFL